MILQIFPSLKIHHYNYDNSTPNTYVATYILLYYSICPFMQICTYIRIMPTHQVNNIRLKKAMELWYDGIIDS